MPFRGRAGLLASRSSPGAPRGEQMGAGGVGNPPWRMRLVAAGIASEERRWRHGPGSGAILPCPEQAAREPAQPPVTPGLQLFLRPRQQ